MTGLLLALLLQGTPFIEGTVVHALSQQPVAGTQIVAVPVGGQWKESRITATDAAGQFRIGNLSPGSYRLFFEHDGFVRGDYAQRAPGKAGVPIEIAAGKSVLGITLPLTPTATINGQVTNSTSNDPVVNATVRALKPTYRDGERSLQAVQSVQTNDLGEYRLFGLIPGRYFLSVTPIPSPSIEGGTLTTPSGGGFSIQQLQNILAAGNPIDPRALDNGTEPTIYLPDTTDAAAAASIDLKAGASYRAPSLRTVRTRSFGVRGQFVDEAGQPVSVTSATLRHANSNETLRTNLMSQSRNTFEFSGLLPGAYEISATVGGAVAEKAGVLSVQIGSENLENLRLVLAPVIQLKGRIVHDGPVPSALRVQLLGTRGISGLQPGPIAADGSFTLTRLVRGDYRLAFVNLPPNMHVRSVRFGTADVLDTSIHIESGVSDSLEIVLGANTGALDAVVVDRNKQPSVAATVVLVPSSGRRGRFELYRTATTDSAGRASLANIAPGAYKLFAWQDIEENAWQNTEAMRPFEDNGVAITIGENGRSSQTITIVE